MAGKARLRVLLLCVAAVAAVVLAVGVGSVSVPPGEILAALASRFTGAPGAADETSFALIWELRLPRVLLAFCTGAALSVGGTVMQSVLQNPLASPFGLGVSAGAGLGAALVIVSGAAGVLGMLLLPTVSFVFGLVTVLLVIGIASRIDRRLSNVTIVLTGLVVSLFCSAVIDLLATLSPTYAQRIGLWQMGSFSMRSWSSVYVLFPALVLCTLLFLRFSREMDILSFGEEQAETMGVDTRRCKGLLLSIVAVLTGLSVAFAGIIGFVDLIAPHVVRRLFGSAHRRVIPAAAVFGGTFMVLCDLAARTLTPPREIPIGAITALLGSPFFLYLFFAGRKR